MRFCRLEKAADVCYFSFVVIWRKQIFKCLLRRLKKKQKRSASSSPSSSSARSSSSSSSSSFSRRRSKRKKKKKQKKSEQASRRHHRVSSRESRRSEEEEWCPAPSDTSATFLNRRQGPGLEEEVGERRISHMYFLSAASDEDGSDSLDKGRKRRDKEQEKWGSSRKTLSRSPEKGERANKVKEESRKDSRRSSIDESTRRRTSCSSAEAEYSRKVTVNRLECRGQERRNSWEGGRYKNSGWQEHPHSERVEEDGRKEGGERESSGLEAGSSSSSAGRPRKELPSSLLDIFSQIAQFEKEKGIKPK